MLCRMVVTHADIRRLERRLQKAGISIAAVCRRADLNQTSWVKWKNGTSSAKIETWRRAERAAEALIDEKSGRAAA